MLIKGKQILDGTISEDKLNFSLSYLHVQTIPATLWVITHNLEKFNSVTIYDDADNIIEGAITAISSTVIHINFNSLLTGRALILKGEINETLNPVPNPNGLTEATLGSTQTIVDIVNDITTNTNDINTLNNTVIDIQTQIDNLPTGGGSVLHTHYAYVDLVNGVDGTGLVGDETKPFLTPLAAQNALVTFGVTTNQPGCLYLRSGTYTSATKIVLKPNILTYCEMGVVFTDGGFEDDINTIKSTVLGYATFKENAILYLGTFATDVHIEAFELYKMSTYSNRGISVQVSSGWSNVNVRLSKCTLGNTAYDITTRGNVNFNFTCETSVEFYYSINNIGSASGVYSTGKIVMSAPSWIAKTGGQFGQTLKYPIRIGQATTGFSWIINGDIITEVGNTGVSLIQVLQYVDGLITVNGNIDLTPTIDAVGLRVEAQPQAGKIIINSPSFKGASTLMTVTRDVNVLFNNVRINKKIGTLTPAFGLALNGVLDMVNCQFIDEDTTIDMISVTSSTAKVNLHRTDAVLVGGGGYLINSGVTTAVLGIKNCISTVNISNLLLHKYSVNNLEVDTLLTLPIY